MNNTIKIDLPSFSLRHTLEAGQCFGWQYVDDSYYGCIEDTAFALSQKGSVLKVSMWKNDKNSNSYEIVNDIEKEEELKKLKHFLSLDAPYEEIINSISKDKYIKEAIGAYYGIRLVKMPHLECAISFILSGNNNVKRIQKGYRLICEMFGNKIMVDDSITLNTFPTLDKLKTGTEEDFVKCNAGYRAKYIKEFVTNLRSGYFNNLDNVPYIEAKEYLTSFLGIGEKIADCILLYSYENDCIYPTDVWVKRFTNELYLKDQKPNEKKIREFGTTYFGEYAGWAQLFLYIFYREKKMFSD